MPERAGVVRVSQTSPHPKPAKPAGVVPVTSTSPNRVERYRCFSKLGSLRLQMGHHEVIIHGIDCRVVIPCVKEVAKSFQLSR